jgi:hypothetical protein
VIPDVDKLQRRNRYSHQNGKKPKEVSHRKKHQPLRSEPSNRPYYWRQKQIERVLRRNRPENAVPAIKQKVGHYLSLFDMQVLRGIEAESLKNQDTDEDKIIQGRYSEKPTQVKLPDSNPSQQTFRQQEGTQDKEKIDANMADTMKRKPWCERHIASRRVTEKNYQYS